MCKQTFFLVAVAVMAASANAGNFRFTVAGDCLPGDTEWPDITYNDLTNEFGSDLVFYPVVGNHDSGMMQWLRDYYDNKLLGNVNPGPPNSVETTYSWDYKNAHFVVLNQYYDGSSDFGTDGDIVDELYNWLVDDLNNTTKPVIFVIGHEPAYPEHRHIGDSLDQYPAHRDRFWKFLNDRKVLVFLCAHTHCYYRKQVDDSDSPLSWEALTWEINNAATSTGTGDKKPTFFNIIVTESQVQFDVWRGDGNNLDRDFIIEDSFILAAPELSCGDPGYPSPLCDLTGPDGIKDCQVDSLDWAVFAAAWRSNTGGENWNQSCDFAEPQGVVDFSDLGVFAENWLRGK